MKILGTGLSGLVGSRIVELLSSDFTFEDMSIETGVDITKFDDIKKRITASIAPWVFHFAAYTDVQGAEKERTLGENSVSWKVNVSATKNIADICQSLGKRLLYISTDYVFDGTKKDYSEEDIPNPQGWYATTKYEGEKAIAEVGDTGLIVRIANPYRGNPIGKKDFVHKIKDRLQSNLPIVAPTDQVMTATFIDDLAYSLKKLVTGNAIGCFHVPGEDSFSPYDGAMTIAQVFHLDTSMISKTTFSTYFEGKAPIPQTAILKHDKIDALGYQLHTFKNGLLEVEKQEQAT